MFFLFSHTKAQFYDDSKVTFLQESIVLINLRKTCLIATNIFSNITACFLLF